MSTLAPESKIPILDLQPEIAEIWDELMPALEATIKGTQFIMGPNVKAFEQETAAYFGVKHAIGLNSGTDALILGVHALGIKPGDEVITTPFTFFATGEAISHFHATPVMVDIDPNTFNLDVDQVAAAITPKTKAILPVHLFGHSADMEPLMKLAEKHNLVVLEDVAQAFGSEYTGQRVGGIGHGGAFSFFPSKNLGGFGDGGLFITNDDAVADTVRMLRVHGARKKYYNEVVGVNSRLDEIQATVLRIKLKRIDQWNEGRRAVAERYNALLAEVEEVATPYEAAYTKHVYHQYTIKIGDGKRDEVQKKLAEQNIGTFVYYPVPMHKLPVYQHMNLTLPIAEQCAAEVLSLPIWPSLDEGTQRRVVNALKDALAYP